MILTRFRQPRFYGWTALAGVTLVYFALCGDISYAYGVFLPAMCQEFGWSRSALSIPYTSLLIVVGILGPLAGISISRFGPRKNIVISNFIAVLGLLGMSIIEETWHVYLFFGVLGGLAISFGEFIPTTAVVNNWFVKRRALALSLLLTSGGVGGFAFPPMISWLITSLGWRLGWICLGVIHLILAVVIGGILIRNRPEDIGQVPDGKAIQVAQETSINNPTAGRVYQTPVDWKLGDALRTPALWLIVFFSSATLYTLNILTTHQVAYLQGLGFSHMTASTAMGLVVGMSIIGRLGCGILGTRFEGRYLAVALLAGLICGMVTLINAGTLPLIYLYATLSGIGYGGILVLMPALFGTYFGRANYPRIAGWTTPVSILLCGFSPLLTGVIYDSTGSYIPAIWVAVAFLVVGLVCAFLARPPKPATSMSR